FWAGCPLVVWAVGIALDVVDLPVDRVDERGASLGVVGTDGGCYLRIVGSELLRLGDNRSERDPRADEARQCGAAGGAGGIAEKVSSGHFHGRTSSARSAAPR